MIFLLQNCFQSFTNFTQTKEQISLSLVPQEIDCLLDFGVAISVSLNILQPEILQFSTVTFCNHEPLSLVFNCHQVPDTVYSACVDVLQSKSINPSDVYIRMRQIDGRYELIYSEKGAPIQNQSLIIILVIVTAVVVIIATAVIVFLVKKYKNRNGGQGQQCSQIMNLETFYDQENMTQQSVSLLSESG